MDKLTLDGNTINYRGVVATLKTHKYVNYVPSVEDVDFDATYYFTDPVLVKNTFKKLVGNRAKIDKKHVKDIKQAYLSNTSEFVDSIRVDINTMYNCDGQHRLQAWLEAKEENPDIVPLRVRFEAYPEDKLIRIIQNINCGTKAWGINDFTNYLEVIGDESIINTKIFGESHRLLAKTNKKGEIVGYYPRYVYAVLLGRNATNDVKSDSFKISNSDLKYGEQIYSEIEKMVDALGYDMNNWFESFCQAWYSLRRDNSFNYYINEMGGLDILYSTIAESFEGTHPISKKADWDAKFRYAVYEAFKKFKNKAA